MKISYDDPVALQIAWNRLIYAADDAARSLGRTAFSTIIREAHDYVTVIMDIEGNAVAQSSRAIPSFISSVPRAARAMLQKYPVATLRPGDVLLTNDPFLGNGHLPDMVMVTPIFRGGRAVGFAGAIAHVPDVGGRVGSAEPSDLHEEGIIIPPLLVRKEFKENSDLMEMIASCVRVPDEVLGDMASMMTANDRAALRVLEMLDDFDLDDLTGIAEALQSRAETAMRRAISKWPSGHYGAELDLDAYGEAVTIRADVEVASDRIHVDFTGSSPQSKFNINVVPNYRYAHTAYALKCLLDPETPNNDGSFRPITDSAPAGSILNPSRTAAVYLRNEVGHAIPSLIFRALQDVVPDRVQGDSGGAPMWSVNAVGVTASGRPFASEYMIHGGQGGRASGPGLAALSFPSNVKTTPAEFYELETPLLIESKALIPDSGGAGHNAGGEGQRTLLTNASAEPVTVYLSTEHIEHPPAGVCGGLPGRPGAVYLDGTPTARKGRLVIAPGSTLTLETPGGGGWGRNAAEAGPPID